MRFLARAAANRAVVAFRDVLEDADLVAHDVFFVFGCDAVDELVEYDLHRTVSLRTRVLVNGRLDDAALHHVDRRRDRVEDDDGEVGALAREQGARGAVGAGGGDEERVGLGMLIEEARRLLVGDHVVVVRLLHAEVAEPRLLF